MCILPLPEGPCRDRDSDETDSDSEGASTASFSLSRAYQQLVQDWLKDMPLDLRRAPVRLMEGMPHEQTPPIPYGVMSTRSSSDPDPGSSVMLSVGQVRRIQEWTAHEHHMRASTIHTTFDSLVAAAKADIEDWQHAVSGSEFYKIYRLVPACLNPWSRVDQRVRGIARRLQTLLRQKGFASSLCCMTGMIVVSSRADEQLSLATEESLMVGLEGMAAMPEEELNRKKRRTMNPPDEEK